MGDAEFFKLPGSRGEFYGGDDCLGRGKGREDGWIKLVFSLDVEFQN
jgi:hypothetical protein